MKKIIVGLAFAALLVSVVLQFTNPFYREPGESRGAHVYQYVPAFIEGWKVEDRSLGATESVIDVVERRLNFDDYSYRRYSRDEKYFEVYVAYWGDGKMPLNQVASHTPDRCWTEAGWSPVDMRFAERIEVNDQPLKPAEWRCFAMGDHQEFVYFWHLVGGRLYDYGERFNATPHPVKWIRDTLNWYMGGSHEQYFIRINSNVPFEQLWPDEGFLEVLESLKGLGLKATPEAI